MVLKWLRLNNVLAWRVPIDRVRKGSGYARSPMRGFPDLFGVFAVGDQRGRLWAIELKAKKGKQSDEQVAVMDKLRAAGAAVTVARSLDEVIAFFEAHSQVVKRQSTIDC